MTEAIRTALQEPLACQRSTKLNHAEQLAADLLAIGRHCATLPVEDDCPDNAILGYNEFGQPS